MKIVLYDPEENNEILDIYEDIQNPIVNGKNIDWEHGSLHGITVPFLVLDDSVDLSNGITSAILGTDKKGKFPKKDPVADRVSAVEMAILTLMNRS